MTTYALVGPGDVIDRRVSNIDPNVQTKPGWRWLPSPSTARPSFNAATEIVEGPAYTVNENDVTEVWTTRDLTAQEISDAKDAAVNTLNGATYPALQRVMVSLINENRELKAKINAMIDAPVLGLVAKFPVGQTTQLTLPQAKTLVKDLL